MNWDKLFEALQALLLFLIVASCVTALAGALIGNLPMIWNATIAAAIGMACLASSNNRDDGGDDDDIDFDDDDFLQVEKEEEAHGMTLVPTHT